MSIFEYYVFTTGEHIDVGPLNEATIKLHMLGREGWELVAVIGTEQLTLFFKRPKQ